MYRVMVMVIPRYYNGAVTNSAFDWRDSNGTSNIMTAWTKPDTGIKVLYDKTFNVNQGYAAAVTGTTTFVGREGHKLVKFYIRSKSGQKLLWAPDGQMVNKPIIIGVYAYDSYGTITTDNIASCTINTKYYWKDV